MYHRFTQYEADWGFPNFISLNELYGEEIENEKPYVFNDEVVFMAIIQLKKDPTGVLWHNFAVYV
jgi:ubiquitin carboxyl-terminal hydrolase 7